VNPIGHNPLLRLAVAALLITAGPAASQTAEQRMDLKTLITFLGFTEDESKKAARGEVVAKILGTREKREVAIVGVLQIGANTECFLARFRDIETFKRNPAVLRTGKLARPIDIDGLERLTLDANDISSLRDCRPGDCGVKLPAGTIEQLRREVNWSFPDQAARAQAVFRERLFDYLQRYLSEGNTALIEYQDKSKPVHLTEEFRALLDATPSLRELTPAFYDYLAAYPAAPLSDVEEFLYWSIENFGFKPVTSVTHVTIFRQSGHAVIASKQIYASHYFNASLGLTFALDDPDAPRTMYLAYLNRSRIDLLGGFFGGLRRLVLRGRLMDGFKKNLRQVASQLSASCDASLDRR
jgi:hypothetical protein